MKEIFFDFAFLFGVVGGVMFLYHGFVLNYWMAAAQIAITAMEFIILSFLLFK